MRSTAGWWRSPRRSRVTGSGVRPVPGRSRRWWRGSWASPRTTRRRSSPWRAGFEEFPRCAAMMRDGQLSLDQVGVIAERAGEGSDEHYAQLASVATVTQLRVAITLEPRPESDPQARSRSARSRKTVSETHTVYRIRLPKLEAATFEAGLESHRDALVAAVETRPRRHRRRPTTATTARRRGRRGSTRCRCRRSPTPSTRS